MKSYILALDEGTTSTRAFLFDKRFNLLCQSNEAIGLFQTGPGKVEQDGDEIFEKSVKVCQETIRKSAISPDEICCLGITNQRGTTLAWDRQTGKPLQRALNWADSRTKDVVKRVEEDGWFEALCDSMPQPRHHSPLIHLSWLLKSDRDFRIKCEKKQAMFGDINTWLVYKLTEGKKYAIDFSNLSTYPGYDLLKMKWREDFLEYLGVPQSILPEIVDTSGEIGIVDKRYFGAEIPITGLIGDQESSSFAMRITKPGTAKCTCGTGAFLCVSAGGTFQPAPASLASAATCKIGSDILFEIQGCVASAGSVLKWIKDGLQMVKEYDEVQPLVTSVPDSNGTFFVPALSGLAAPHWDPGARGIFMGLTHSTTRAHIVRAALEGIAFRIKDICEVLRSECKLNLQVLRVDGGLSKSDFFCQTIADLLDVRVERPDITEASGLGAAEMAGMHIGIWGEDDIDRTISKLDMFTPMDSAQLLRDSLYGEWKRALEKSKSWCSESSS